MAYMLVHTKGTGSVRCCIPACVVRKAVKPENLARSGSTSMPHMIRTTWPQGQPAVSMPLKHG